MCSAKAPHLQVLVNDCKILNGYYIDTRYPVHWPTAYNKDEATRAKLAAENIGTEIKNVLD